MHTVPISFCSGTAYHITDDAIKEEVLRDLSDRMKVRTMMREAKVYRPDAGQDTAGTYVTHLQTRGNPYVIFLTRLGFTETSLYVDRKVRPGHSLPRIILDHVMFDPSLYTGTAMSGEMIRTEDGEWRFLVEDLLAVRGRPLGNIGYRERYAALLQVVDSCEQHVLSTHRIAVKRVFPADDDGFDALQQHADTVPYGYTGCIMRSLVPGKSNWFVRSENVARTPSINDTVTKVLSVRSTVTPDVYEVYDLESNRKEGLLGVQSIEVSRELAEAFKDGKCGAVKWKCKWNELFYKWIPLGGGLMP